MKNKILLPFAIMLNFLVFGQNIVVNGNFSDGLNAWSTFLADWEGVNANYSTSNDEANITGIVNAGGNTWWVQLNQILTPEQIGSLSIGQNYEITFDARSSVSGRPLRMYFGENGGGFAAVAVQDFTINTTMSNYSVTFSLNNTYGAMKLGFEMGTANDDVFIDNVVLQVSSATAPPAQPAGFIAENNVGGTPVANGEAFLACGPNNVGGNIVYRLFYSPTASVPANPMDATQYTFGSTAGDGGGNNAFGFTMTGLQAGTNYTFWLYQYNTAENLYSTPAIATVTTPGGGGGSITAVPVTFRVDMSNVPAGSFTTPEVNGTFNNWCGNCAPMTNVSGSIWELTIQLEPGNYEYKFSYDGFEGQESLVEGSPCTITSFGYTNRTLVVTEAATLPLVCWSSCVSCANTTTRTVTFRVDMSNVPAGSFTTPEVNGTFNNWCGSCAPMTNVSGSIWQLAITLEDGTYEYKFSHDNWAGSEQLTPGSSCTVSNGEFTNRALVVTESTILPIACWGYCVACEFVGLNEEELMSISIYPNPSNDVLNITSDDNMLGYTIYDFAGKVVMQNSNTSTEWSVPVVNLSNGLYNIHVRTNNGVVFRNFVKN